MLSDCDEIRIVRIIQQHRRGWMLASLAISLYLKHPYMFLRDFPSVGRNIFRYGGSGSQLALMDARDAHPAIEGDNNDG